MAKARKDYAFVATRKPPNSTYGGDFVVHRKVPADWRNPDGKRGTNYFRYQCASEEYEKQDYPADGWYMYPGRIATHSGPFGSIIFITKGSYIYEECMKAIERLKKEEAENGN